MKGPWGRVEGLPLDEFVVVNAQSSVAARQMHIAAALRRENEISHSRIHVDAINS